jgi:hypothetical protein
MCCYKCGATFPSRYDNKIMVRQWNTRAQAAQELASDNEIQSSDGSQAADGAIGARGLTDAHCKCDPSKREGKTTSLAGVAPGPSDIKALNLHKALRELLIEHKDLIKDTNSEPTFGEYGSIERMGRILYDNMPLADWESAPASAIGAPSPESTGVDSSAVQVAIVVEALNKWANAFEAFENFDEDLTPAFEENRKLLRKSIELINALSKDDAHEPAVGGLPSVDGWRLVPTKILADMISILPPAPAEVYGVTYFFQIPQPQEALFQLRNLMTDLLAAVPDPQLARVVGLHQQAQSMPDADEIIAGISKSEAK